MVPIEGQARSRVLSLLGTVALIAIAIAPVRAQTAEELEKSYRRQTMEQALQTKQRFDLYGLHFDSNKATIQSASNPLLDDIATALKGFPEWHLRIVGHTDATGDPESNLNLSLERANAIQAALIERGVDRSRLATAGLGENQPVASDKTPDGRALNRRVELVRFTVSAEAKKMLKAMSDFLAAQTTLSVGLRHRSRSRYTQRSEAGTGKLGNRVACSAGQGPCFAVRRVC